MFGLAVATEIIQGSTERTWNFILHYTQVIWSKLNQLGKPIMPKSRKRHHSRSRSKTRSHSRDRSREREDKHRKLDCYEKDRDGKRRKLDSSDSPYHKRSVSSDPECPMQPISSDEEMDKLELQDDTVDTPEPNSISTKSVTPESSKHDVTNENPSNKTPLSVNTSFETNLDLNADVEIPSQNESKDLSRDRTDSDEKGTVSFNESTPNRRTKIEITPKKILSPKQLQKKGESEKKRQEKQREKEEKEKKRNQEKEQFKQERLKKKEEKLKEIEQKQKEKELKEAQKKEEREKKEEQKRKEREEKEQKRKEKEEREEQKRKEREMEKMKKQQDLEEKNKEKQKEEEKKQKAAAAFVNFFVPKKTENSQERRYDEPPSSLFMAFQVKSDMRLPPARREHLSTEEVNNLDGHLQQQCNSVSYLDELKQGSIIRSSSKTWRYQENIDDDVTVVEDDTNLGETISGDNSKLQKFRAKFLKFHENRRPAYYGTWRKKSKYITGRKPLMEDKDYLNYEEDSDDDWEEEEQGESLNGSDDEEKENEEERDEYEVDNEFFVPHGHLSDDEIDDEQKARLSPESLKQKLKLLKDEFEQDMQSKTHKLKSRSIGCIWYNKDGIYIDEAIDRYLQPLAIIANEPIHIKKRSEIFVLNRLRRKQAHELNPEYIPIFLKIIHGNSNKKTVLIEQFLTSMVNKGVNIDLKKGTLIKVLKQLATWKPTKEKNCSKIKYCWLVNEDIEKKFRMDVCLPNILEIQKNDI